MEIQKAPVKEPDNLPWSLLEPGPKEKLRNPWRTACLAEFLLLSFFLYDKIHPLAERSNPFEDWGVGTIYRGVDALILLTWWGCGLVLCVQFKEFIDRFRKRAKSRDEVRWYREKADHGDASALVILGLMYSKGRGVPQNGTTAASWYHKAYVLYERTAFQGDAHAQAMLGSMYNVGRGVEKDWVQAARWYRKAADQGHASAQAILEMMYKQGLAVPQDAASQDDADKWTGQLSTFL